MVMANKRVAVIEELLPDFLSIMSSNIRSGLTYDRALLLSARKEFGPLSKEVDRAAKEVISGKTLPDALMGMTTRVRSESFAKTMRLIVEGVRSGGKLADFAGGAAIDKSEILKVDCDVLVPAAIGGVIDEKSAGDVRAKYVVEAANGPTTPEGKTEKKRKERERVRRRERKLSFSLLLSPNPFPSPSAPKPTL